MKKPKKPKASSAGNKASRSKLRAAAARVMLEVLKGQSLSRALPAAAENVAENERPRLGEIVYGSCRHYYQLQAVLSELMSKPMRSRDRVIETLLLTSLYQLIHMRIADHAIVTEAVESARQLKRPMFSKLVNGVLRGFLRNRDVLLATVSEQPEVRHGLPLWLVEKLQQDWPRDWSEIAASFLQQPAFTLRINLQRIAAQDYLQKLTDQQIDFRTVEGMPSAVTLAQAQAVMTLPGFAEGMVSVQDAGAQLAAVLLNPQAGERILDACAAPGGKTGHLLESAQHLQLTAIDVDESRLQRVRENLQRLQLQAKVLSGDAAAPSGEWADQSYDAILLDVPCSATGVIRRHPDIRLLRRASDIDSLIALQQQILLQCWALLKPGGRLLYATCSLLSAENEQQIARFIQQCSDADEVVLDPQIRHHKRHYGIQLTPEKNDMDGFYYALLQKHND